jgi:RNA-binding protein
MNNPPLTNAEIRVLKARAQRLPAAFKLGKAGLSEGFVKSIDAAFAHTDLIKVKFVEFKDDKKSLAPELAEKTRSRLIMRVGNVAALHRRRVELQDEGGLAPSAPATGPAAS